MGLAERIFDGLRTTLELRGDVDRLATEVQDAKASILDHEKRLIRIETLIEVSQSRPRPSLPGASE